MADAKAKKIGQLYNVEIHAINYHLKKVFADSELQDGSAIRNFRIAAADGKIYDTKHYNLASIIAVGYKVNSERAVQFRKWATIYRPGTTLSGCPAISEYYDRDRPTLYKSIRSVRENGMDMTGCQQLHKNPANRSVLVGSAEGEAADVTIHEIGQCRRCFKGWGQSNRRCRLDCGGKFRRCQFTRQCRLDSPILAVKRSVETEEGGGDAFDAEGFQHKPNELKSPCPGEETMAWSCSVNDFTSTRLCILISRIQYKYV